MKKFILRARKAWTSSVDINKLPQQGKLDSVCAAVTGALWFSGGVRNDTIIHVVLEGPNNGPKTITFNGAEIRGLRHDERSMADYISLALQKGAWLQLNEEAHVRTGITVSKKSFERLVWEICKDATNVFVLDGSGKDVRNVKFSKDCVIIFGSAEGLPPKTEALLSNIKAEKISLGPKTLFAAQCPVIVHNEMDRQKI